MSATGIPLRIGYRWPEDRIDAVADWLDKYPPPPLAESQTRLIVDTWRSVFEREAVRGERP